MSDPWKDKWVSDCGTVTLYCGDCLEILPTLGKVDAVVTDPPYGMSYQSSWRIDKTERFSQIAGDDAPFVWFLPMVFRVSADPSCLVCFCRWDSAEAFRTCIGWAGYDVAGQLIWDRVVHGMGDLRASPAPMHDTAWVARKGKWKFPGERGKSVLRHQRISGDMLSHPTEKPTSLMNELIGTYSQEKAIVLDPFMGSGTTGVACVRLNRKFIGIEIDPGYFEIAKKRIQDELSSTPLFAEEAKQIQAELWGDDEASPIHSTGSEQVG